MKKFFITLTIITVLGIIASVGYIIYNKYQEVELEKTELKKQINENNKISSSNANKYYNDSETNTNNFNEQATTNNVENSNLKVTRDNVFDYLIAGINQSEGGNASLLKFQEPEEQENGSWKISANNKSGVGSNTFIVRQDGVVEFWDGFMDEKFDEQKVTLN